MATGTGKFLRIRPTFPTFWAGTGSSLQRRTWGPFVKLAFYVAKRGNRHSIFLVREIDSIEKRGLVNWWFITFDQLARFAF